MMFKECSLVEIMYWDVFVSFLKLGIYPNHFSIKFCLTFRKEEKKIYKTNYLCKIKISKKNWIFFVHVYLAMYNVNIFFLTRM